MRMRTRRRAKERKKKMVNDMDRKSMRRMKRTQGRNEKD